MADTSEGSSGSSSSGGGAAGVFVASFHVRAGNSLSFVHPPELAADLGHAHAEWKALPSGSHAVERDTVFFALDEQRTAVACFRNVALQPDDDAEQRGARMLSVGAVFRCGQQQQHPPLHLVRALDAAADRIASTAHQEGSETSQRILKEWLHAADNSSAADAGHSEDFHHSPLSHLPALSASLGPLLPPLLKRMATGHTRLLIYSTAPLQPAASLAYNIADIVQVARSRADQNGGARPVHVRGLVTLHDIVELEAEGRQRTPTSPGWIAFTSDKILLDKCALFDLLLDLTPLQASAGSKAAASPRNQPGPSAANPASSGTKPRLSVVVPVPSSSSSARPGLKLKSCSWSTQEYAEMRLVEEKVRRHMDSPSALSRADSADSAPSSPTPPAEDNVFAARRVTSVRNRKPSDQGTSVAAANATRSSHRRPLSSLQPRSRGVFLNLVALLRFVFAQTLWFFPSAFWTPASASTSALALLGSSNAPGGRRRRRISRAAGSSLGLGSEATSLADSAFILPLGVRPDGGLRASVVLDDPNEAEEPEQDAEEEEDEDAPGDQPNTDTGSTIGDRSSSATLRLPSTADQRLVDVDTEQTPGIEARRRSGASAQSIPRPAVLAAAAALDDDADAPGSPDPFLAACGAGGNGAAGSGPGTHLRNVRNSRSSLLSSASGARLRNVLMEPSSSATVLADDSAILSDEENDEDDADEAAEEDAMARALASTLRDAWVDWLAVLFAEIAALVAPPSSPSDLDSFSAVLDATDLASVGLSTRNEADCALVRAVARGVAPDGAGEVVIRTGWSWANIFR